MKRLILSFCLALSCVACIPKTPATIVTPAGQSAYVADQYVAKFTELSNIVKADVGSQSGNISYADAFTIIEWISGDAHGTPPTTGLVQIIQTTAGQGWKAGALESWNTRIRPLLNRYPALVPWVSIVDGLLTEVA